MDGIGQLVRRWMARCRCRSESRWVEYYVQLSSDQYERVSEGQRLHCGLSVYVKIARCLGGPKSKAGTARRLYGLNHRTSRSSFGLERKTLRRPLFRGFQRKNNLERTTRRSFATSRDRADNGQQ